MADARLMIPFIKKWEGGYANDPDDKGGCTMMGVTIKVYQKYFGKDKTCEDLKNITDEEWLEIFKDGYWKPWKADEIKNQSIAQLCVDMGWGSGPKTAIKKVQECLGCKPDGIVGPKTLAALNANPSSGVFRRLWVMRYQWLIEISKKGNNKKFLRGWHNRLNDIKYRMI
jgi:lysozyme family protein